MTRSKFIILSCAALAAVCFIACGGYGPEQTVKIQVTGADADAYDEITEKIKTMTDGGGHMTYRLNNTITLAPVTDLQAFADKIDFGTVTEVDEETRTVFVTIGDDEPTPVAPLDGGEPAADAADSPATPAAPADGNK
ncbi:MAG: hypothetical protein RIC55_18490 [Pirellulaceae bacterium]